MLLPVGAACTAAETPEARPAPDRTDSSVSVSVAPVESPTVPAAPVPASTPAAPATNGADQAAPVRRLAVSDPRGDVDPPRQGHWFGPSVDITGFRVSPDASSRRLRLTIEFADLRGLEHRRARYAHSITVHSNADGRSLYFERHALHGESLASRTVAPLLHYGQATRPCQDATYDVDLDADAVVFSVPVRCLVGKSRVAQFLVTTNGARVFQDERQSRNIGSDALETSRLVRVG